MLPLANCRLVKSRSTANFAATSVDDLSQSEAKSRVLKISSFRRVLTKMNQFEITCLVLNIVATGWFGYGSAQTFGNIKNCPDHIFFVEGTLLKSRFSHSSKIL